MSGAIPTVMQNAQPVITVCTNAKQNPLFKHLPSFKPPAFHGENGLPPCPETPESTPRGEYDDDASDLLEDSYSNSVQDFAGPIAPGSLVEYNSRSSGSWLQAKVQSYDAVSDTYCLDVQPQAKPDRVRLRRDTATSSRQNVSHRMELQDAAHEQVRRQTEGACYGGRYHAGANNTDFRFTFDAPPIPSSSFDVLTRSQLITEVEALRRQNQLLIAENQTLRAQIPRGASLKGGYQAAVPG